MSSGAERFIRPHFRMMRPYQPIVPTEELGKRHGISAESVIKLDGNENPYGCSPRVRRSLAGYSHYHIYPDPEHLELRRALGEYVGVDAAHIVAGSGSDELIDLILRLFLEPGDWVINCPPTFGMYPFCTDICGGKVAEVLRDERFAVDVAGIKTAIDERTKVLFVASPNNPSGNTVPEQDILALVDSGIMVVVDEAYYEFSGATVAGLVPEYDNLIVLRTFSKWAGLAGLRVGYGIFPINIAQHLMKTKLPYNVNAAAYVAALESLTDLGHLRRKVKAINKERGRLFRKLKKTGYLQPFPSEANFILCRVLDGKAMDIYEGLQKDGIFIRYFDAPLLRNYLRISVGRPEHTDALMEALAKIANSGG